MTNTATFVLWGTPTIITVLIWVIVNSRPLPPPKGGMFDFGAAFTAFLRVVSCLVATLAIWLTTFVVAYLLS